MALEFQQIHWDASLRREVIALVRLAIREDLGRLGDQTSKALIPAKARGAAEVVARQAGIVAGLPAAETAVHLVDRSVVWTACVEDGRAIQAGQCVARLEGPVRGILAAERVLLNLLARLSGIATLARRYVDAVAGTRARIYDTRKTTPGWRRLEKYAVRMGGGCNHRTGLYDAILIKDNHLAFGRQGATKGFSPAEAVRLARRWIQRRVAPEIAARMIVEIEVDTLAQFDEVLSAAPDLVLLDNMTPDQLREAVKRRDAAAPGIELEASGGIHLENIGPIAQTGVDRISIGALTHSPPALDFGLDWARCLKG